MNKKFRAMLAAPAAIVAVTAAGCTHHAGGHHLTPAQKTALAPYEKLVGQDVHKVGGPYALVRSKDARHALVTDLEGAVPKSARQSFVNEATVDALHGRLYTHSGLQTYLQATLPALLKQDGARLS